MVPAVNLEVCLAAADIIQVDLTVLTTVQMKVCFLERVDWVGRVY